MAATWSKKGTWKILTHGALRPQVFPLVKWRPWDMGDVVSLTAHETSPYVNSVEKVYLKVFIMWEIVINTSPCAFSA